MKVLHVISSLDPAAGGVTSVVQGLAAAQARAGLDVRVVAPTKGDGQQQTLDALRGAGVAVTLAPRGRPPTGWSWGLPALMRRLAADVDLVHIHALWEEIQHAGARAAQRLNKPYILAPHGMLDPWSLAQSKLRKQLYLALRLRRNLDRAAAIHFTAQREAELVEPLGLRPQAIVEPNGLDLSEFDDLPPREELASWLPETAGRKVLLFFSRLHPKKGLDLLLPAFKAVDDPQLVLVLAGPATPEYRSELEHTARQLGVADRVIFTGMLTGRKRLSALTGADLFVLPSYQENFGIVVIESLICRTPVVISDQVNIFREIVASGGGAATPTQLEPLTAALRQWLSDPERREQAGRRGAAFVREQYDWAKLAQRWTGHYEKLLA